MYDRCYENSSYLLIIFGTPTKQIIDNELKMLYYNNRFSSRIRRKRMYSLNIPLSNNVDFSEKKELVSYLKKAKTDRVFILFNQILNAPDELERELKSLGNTIDFFNRNGIKTGV